MNVLPVLEFLRQKIGLNPESIGTESIEKVVRDQMKMSGAVSVGDYINKVNESSAQQKMLIESVVISETSFFRNKIPFVTLQNYLERFVLNKKPDRPIRILCLPCATGEEPYSIAMVLSDMKLPAQKFFIYAADISEQALQIAKSGMYGPYSFRGKDIDFRNRYFSEMDGGYLLKQEVRDAVEFGQENILAANFLSGHEPYDIIFCRNLLIYFDDDAKEKAIKALAAHLAEEGVLFVGHAEGAKIPQLGFVSLDYPMSFAFARIRHAKVINASLNKSSPAQKTFAAPNTILHSAVKAKPVPLPKKVAPITSEHEWNRVREESADKKPRGKGIAEAMKLADEGAFVEVVAMCEDLLAQGTESAEVYYLLGQASGETGNSLMAEECLRKAIYLNADFHDALMYLSILFDRMGSHEKAATFRRRAERVHLRNAGK
ncbi:putative biofilm formation methyltransferase WspC [Methylophilaceae bacterium]|nr:putative biofilm formation methyltransferase WspC [Methylophilaceae bacterium]